MNQVEAFQTQDVSHTKFNPKFLHELVDYLYDTQPKVIKDFALNQILEDDQSKGRFWEKVIAKSMTHAVLLERNAPYRDYSDNSDAKFCMLVRYSSGTMQATISGVENKIGDLRVCICVRGQNVHRLYFLRIPYSYYSKLSGYPIKITFKHFTPIGEVWDKFNCSFTEVVAP